MIESKPRTLAPLRYPPIIILLSLATLILFVYAIYQLSQVLISAEMERQAESALIRHADSGAAEIAESWDFTRTAPFADPDNKIPVVKILIRLVQNQPNVIAAMLTDRHGRIQMSCVEQKRGLVDLGPEYRDARAFVGIGEDEVVHRLTQLFPTLHVMTNDVSRNGEGIGQLILFVDRGSQDDMPHETSMRLATWLGLMLFGVALLIGAALWTIRREQIVAERLRMQRDKAERSAYVGALAAGLAHEIRNPINALNMQLEMLEEDISEGDRASSDKRLQRLREGLQGVEHTVRDFLTYATPHTQKPTLIELAPDLESLCAAATAQESTPSIEIKCLVPRGMRAWCDPHALRQIVSNLLANAIRIQRQKGERIAIRVEAVRQGSKVEVIIDDAGPGIPPGHAETIFEAFYTTHTQGTGLGLAIARRLAEMNGGSLIALDAPSPLGGARFSLTLPGQHLEQSP